MRKFVYFYLSEKSAVPSMPQWGKQGNVDQYAYLLGIYLSESAFPIFTC